MKSGRRRCHRTCGHGLGSGGTRFVPLFFDERRRKLGWHIDYVLMHREQLHRVRNVELGDFWEWVASGRSDHVPLIIDLDW